MFTINNQSINQQRSHYAENTSLLYAMLNIIVSFSMLKFTNDCV